MMVGDGDGHKFPTRALFNERRGPFFSFFFMLLFTPGQMRTRPSRVARSVDFKICLLPNSTRVATFCVSHRKYASYLLCSQNEAKRRSCQQISPVKWMH